MMAVVEEVFVPIEGFENYEVSNFGRVVNTDTGRDLKGTLKGSGLRLGVDLCKDGVRTHFYIHRLVAQAFFLNYDDDLEVLLISDDPYDCGVRNITLSDKPRKRKRDAK